MQGYLPVAGVREKFDLSIEDEKWRDAVGCRRGVAQISRDCASILNLNRTHFAGGAFQGVKARRESGVNDISPCRQRADAKVAAFAGDAAELGQRGDVYDRLLNDSFTQSGVEIGSSSENL